MLTQTQLNSFNRDGFLVLDKVLSEQDIVPFEKEYADLLDAKCTTLFQQGPIFVDFQWKVLI